MTVNQPSLFAVRDQRQPGWFFVDNEIVDRYGSQIGAYGVAVYNVLCRHAKNGSQRVELSARDIGATLGISHDRVGKSLTDLVDVGLIDLEVPAHPGPGVVSIITLLNAKATGRHTSSSSDELDATRPCNKERKTKTKTKPLPPTPLEEGGISTIWQNACFYLKDRLGSTYVHAPHFQEDCYEKFFRDAWLVDIGAGVATLDSHNSTLLMQGVEQFQQRLLDAFRRAGVQLSAVRAKESQLPSLEASA
jgi:hypothetical protein